MIIGILATFWSQFVWVQATNFGGHDEWLIVSLNAKHVVGFPYANRPLVLLGSLPVALLWPHDLKAYLFFHTLYLSLAGALVFLLLRRLAPRSSLLAFLTAVFSLVWVPLDFMRLDTVLLTGYSGFTFLTFLALFLLVESWQRQSVVLLVAGALLAFVTTRGGEATVPMVALAPALLIPMRGDRRLWAWVIAWESLVVAGVALILAPLAGPGQGTYQLSALGLDPQPLHVAGRLLEQFRFHLLPLVTSPPREMAGAGVIAAAGVFGLAYAGATRNDAAAQPGGADSRFLRGAMLLGLVWAGLGYAVYTLSRAINTPARTQILSSPGIGLFLAGGLCLMGRAFAPPWRRLAVGLLAAWVVAVGTGRTLAMQRDWDMASAWPAQNSTLVNLTRAAPDLKPNTFVLLIDEAGAWPATFTFRHAVDYLYRGRAIGSVWGGQAFLYPTVFASDGIHSDPWEVIRKPWGSAASHHGYDEVVVVALRATGELTILDRWPGFLPSLPPGTVYKPRDRIVAGGFLPEARGILVGGP
jgi:hypothetical protein